MNSKFNGMPTWALSEEKCPVTQGFAGGTMTPGKISATTPKYQEQEKREQQK